MCGIAWFLLHNFTEEQIKRVQDQANKISYRGPDATQIEINDNELWAFHRLAIINLDPKGIQPFTSSIGSRLICNGEIYNFRDLIKESTARSDCDAVLHSLDSTLENFDSKTVCKAVDKLDGDFAFVWRNGENTVIGRDCVGVTPLFYAVNEKDELVAVASECKALLNTPFTQTIKVFPPGHIWMNGNFYSYHTFKKTEESSAFNTIQPPGDFNRTLADAQVLLKPLEESNSSKEDAILKVRELLTDAVRKRIAHSDRPVGILCSGGIDSSIVAALVKELGAQERIHVFTMEYKGARSEDTFYASMLCEKLGLKHTVLSFTLDDIKTIYPSIPKAIETYDPNTVRAALPMYLMAHKISETTDIKVILSGEGADELFHGYNYFRRAPDGEAAQVEAGRLIKNLHMFDLLRAERCFSSAGLEVRVPFLDKHLIDYVQSLDGKLPWGGQGYAEKQLLRDSFAYVPHLSALRILDRPKERFSDGCGFTYVPQLLSYLSNGSLMLEERLIAEKKYVGELFDSVYPNMRHLIVNRSMPSWIEEMKQDPLVLM